jgi:hypothetical protein
VTNAPKTRYSLVEASRLAHMHTDKLGSLIVRGEVAGCRKVDCRYIIPIGHFDRFLGITTPRHPFIVDINAQRRKVVAS